MIVLDAVIEFLCFFPGFSDIGSFLGLKVLVFLVEKLFVIFAFFDNLVEMIFFIFA